jgi:hypothetical protein
VLFRSPDPRIGVILSARHDEISSRSSYSPSCSWRPSSPAVLRFRRPTPSRDPEGRGQWRERAFGWTLGLDWPAGVHEHPQKAIEAHSACIGTVRDGEAPVAIFDWDNTVVKNDIGYATSFWMLLTRTGRRQTATGPICVMPVNWWWASMITPISSAGTRLLEPSLRGPATSCRGRLSDAWGAGATQ